MAKKGAAQQLQAELHTDEEFDAFLERPGLLVMDVYSEWCGPCLGMVSSLRKVKLEIAGDKLQLATCNADTISYLKRFQRTSEPIWLFATDGMAVNIMFGSNVPKLIKMIIQELKYYTEKTKRHRYKITEPQPEEVERIERREYEINEALRIEAEERAQQRTDYLNYVTDTIMENLFDMGVTIFGPHINREMYKIITDPAERLKIQCKERKVAVATKEDFEIINYACTNPLPPEVIDILDEKELFLCFWKANDSVRTTVPQQLLELADLLTKTTQLVDETTEEITEIPPILMPLQVKIKYEIPEEEECPYSEDDSESIEEPKTSDIRIPVADEELLEVEELGEEEAEGDEEGEEEEEAEPQPEPEPSVASTLSVMSDMDMDAFQTASMLDEMGEEEEEESVDIEKRYCVNKITVPAVWVPADHRTHAALIYVFFRSTTTTFLPPDPVPETPHIVMAFDTYKRRDLVDIAKRHKDEIPLFGFFTSDDADEAKFIANSAEKYNENKPKYDDKLVMKVNKKTSHTMLLLASYGPSYVSPTTVVGKEEALKFFPENYLTAEKEAEDAKEALIREQEDMESKKKRRSKQVIIATPEEELEQEPIAEALLEEEGLAEEGEGASGAAGASEADSAPEGAAGTSPPPGEEQPAAVAAEGEEAHASAEAPSETAAETPAEAPPTVESEPAPAADAPEAAPESAPPASEPEAAEPVQSEPPVE